MLSFFFFFNDTATTEIYTLSLHDALPISDRDRLHRGRAPRPPPPRRTGDAGPLGRHRADRGRRGPGLTHLTRARVRCVRSEEHTSELQSLAYLVCRLLLEKKKKKNKS